MSKIAFIFPGQGAQYCGMGQDFYEKNSTARQIYDKATELLGFSMPQLCFEDQDRLDRTEYTQAAMVTTSIAMMRVLEEQGIFPDVAAGLSLGEYCAMAAAGVMSDEDAIRTVRERGILMQEAVPVGIGSMAAVLGLNAGQIEEVLAPLQDVQIANYNCPGQIVISGKKEAVEEASVLLKEAGAKRIVPLNVSGPFHSSMLKEAGEKLAQVLENVQIYDPVIPYASNVTAEYVRSADEVRSLLAKQVSSSVRWQQTMEMMIQDGVDIFIEIGPGRTLSGFMKKIAKDVKVLRVEKIEDIEQTVQALNV